VNPSGAALVQQTRRVIGPIGVFLPFPTSQAPSADDQIGAVRRWETAGHRAIWVNEVPGKDALVQASVLLAATSHVVVGTGIANIWTRTASTVRGAATLLAQAYPGRVFLGLGVGYPAQAAAAGQDFGRPLATMRNYLQHIDAPAMAPTPDVTYPRLVAANGPNMLTLAGEMADGALPAMVPPEFTADARRILGPDKLLVVLVDAGPGPDHDVALTTRISQHLAAGADHVVAVLPIGSEFAAGVNRFERLAPALLQLG